MSPQNCKDFPPKAKDPGNAIPKFHIFSNPNLFTCDPISIYLRFGDPVPNYICHAQCKIQFTGLQITIIYSTTS